jgi:glutathione synthase/RimK-type ligase-like ATP-grasp enzyme
MTKNKYLIENLFKNKLNLKGNFMTVLIITNKDDITVDFVVKELQLREIPYYRFNTEDIPQKLKVSFDLEENTFELIDDIKKISLSLNDFDSVYYRRPQLNTLEYIDELNYTEKLYLLSELNFVLEGIYKILEKKYWLNNVYRIREAENKIYQLQLAKEIGFMIPNTIIANRYETIKSFVKKNHEECIIKPIKSGHVSDGDNSKAIFTTKLDQKHLIDSERIESFPLYLQKNIEKISDIRVTVVGDKVFSAAIHSQKYIESSIDWRRGIKPLDHVKHFLPKDVEKMSIQLTKRLGLNYSAIDLIYTKEKDYIFLEINPNGQWAWIQNLLDFPISREIVNLLER